MMFLVTTAGVREQDGVAMFYLFPDDIDLLAKNENSRAIFLNTLNTRSVIVDTVVKPSINELNLEAIVDYGTGIHSKL